MNSFDFRRDIKDGTKEWERIDNVDIPVFYLYYYLPKNSNLAPTSAEKWARNFIWNFKDGNNSEEAAKQVIEVLKHFFLADTLDMLTFACIPASTQEKNEERYEWFSNEVASECNMWDAYDHIELDYDRDATHLGGDNDFSNLSFDEDFFDGKHVILFDDIITKGHSINSMVDYLEDLGANVIGAITLGRTVHRHHGTDPYDDMDFPIKTISKKVVKKEASSISESALESKRLYQYGYSVAQIASTRGLAESTVYGHLFKAGALDPWDYITKGQFNKAMGIYDAGYEYPSQELDKFLSVAAKAAFYEIRRNS